MAGKLFDGVARFDISFYESLSRMVNEEPIMNRDLLSVNILSSIGIKKGKTFNPDTATKEILVKAIKEAQQGFIQTNQKLNPFYEDKQWLLPATKLAHETGFTFFNSEEYALESRAAFFFLGCAPPKKPGGASFYLFGQKDADGTILQGSNNYKLNVPANVPIKQFWAATVYDQLESNLIRESPKVEVNSYHNLQKNADGSVDVYFGSKAPKGKESNWVYTAPDKAWIMLFRFYGPKPELFSKTWRLPDIQKI